MKCGCEPNPVLDPSTCFAKFWMVLNDSTSQCSVQGLPTFRHQSHSSAAKEAARLANANPGILFYVLEATDACRKSDVEWMTGTEALPF